MSETWSVLFNCDGKEKAQQLEEFITTNFPSLDVEILEGDEAKAHLWLKDRVGCYVSKVNQGQHIKIKKFGEQNKIWFSTSEKL